MPPTQEEGFAGVRVTHSGVVVFVGDRAFKMKRPVDLGFLDFRDVRARYATCAREVELNRRLAPDVYRGIGWLVAPDAVAEPLVVMNRLPAERRLSHLVTQRQAVPQDLRQVARLLARFHARSPRSAEISRAGARDELQARWEQSLQQVRSFDDLLPAAVVDEVERLVHDFLAGRQALFELRLKTGCIVDGHGDLLAEDIFCLADGPRILDCLEFDDALRHVDRIDDIAFLAMDLEHLGAPALAAGLVTSYAEFSGDSAGDSLLHHYVAYRAFVRAKVSCLQGGSPDRPPGPEARSYAELALRHLRAGAVRLVLVGGLPGTGKSTLAGGLADRLGWVCLSSDRVRKELAGIDPLESARAAYQEGIYSPDWTERTYDELLRRAEVLMGLGESVVLDASWTAAGHRDEAASLADRCHATLTGLRCELDPLTAAQRMSDRVGMSDADARIAAALGEDLAPWPESIEMDTSRPREEVVHHACAVVSPTEPRRHRLPVMAPD